MENTMEYLILRTQKNTASSAMSHLQTIDSYESYE